MPRPCHALARLLCLTVVCVGSLQVLACTKIEDTWQYEQVEESQNRINHRARVAVIAGLAHARAEGKSDVPADDDVPAQLLRDDGSLDPLIEQYGLNDDGSLRGDGPTLSMLLIELELAQKSLATEKDKPEYLVSDML